MFIKKTVCVLCVRYTFSSIQLKGIFKKYIFILLSTMLKPFNMREKTVQSQPVVLQVNVQLTTSRHCVGDSSRRAGVEPDDRGANYTAYS